MCIHGAIYDVSDAMALSIQHSQPTSRTKRSSRLNEGLAHYMNKAVVDLHIFDPGYLLSAILHLDSNSNNNHIDNI